jgi:hypothetical protein
MKFYGIDMAGKLLMEEADIVPATSEHDRRFVRDTDGRIYVGNTTVGYYVEIITDFDYSTVGGLPVNIQQAFQAEFHPVGGDDTTEFTAPLYHPETGSNRLATDGDWFYAAVGDPVDSVGGQGTRWGGLMVNVTPDLDPDNDAICYYDGGAVVDGDGYGHEWRIAGPSYLGGEQRIATREWVNNFYLQGNGTGVGTGDLAAYYTRAECDALFLADADNAQARDFADYRDNIVFTEGHIVAEGFGTVEARVANSGSTYSNALGANHVVQRNGSGNIFANIGYLQATSAQYADLAEKYTCDPDLPVGTVVAVPVDGYSDYEVVPFDFDNAPNCVGVVSEAPAYLMNSESEGLPIGLTGKVPVRVVGEIRKGEFLVPSAMDKGCAIKGNPETNMNKKIAIALETNLQDGEKLVECIIK